MRMNEIQKESVRAKFWRYMEIWQPVIDELCKQGYTKDQAILIIGFCISGE